MRKNLVFLLILSAVKLHAQSFKPVIVNPFGINTNSLEYNDMLFSDLTQDGNFDIIFTGLDEGPFIMVNKGTLGSPSFEDVPYLTFFWFNENQVGQGTFTSPTSSFVDGDGDGDLDHLFFLGSDDPSFSSEYVLELNTPELAAPAYKFYFQEEAISGSDLGLPYQPIGVLETHTLGDLNGDGNLDMLASRFFETTGEQSYVFYENMANMSSLMFNGMATINPFGLFPNNDGAEVFGFPGLFDPDSDGDLDLLVSKLSGDWTYHENIGTSTEPLFAQPVSNPFGLTPLPVFGMVHFIDVNGDGKEDLICGAGNKVFYFEFDESSSVNRSEKTVPSFTVSPNPSTDFILVNSKGCLPSKFRILDIYGTYVQQGSIYNADNQKIQTESLLNGVYFLEIAGENEVFSCIKFVKQ